MNIDQLRRLVAKGESDRLEFKKSTGDLKGGMETLCGFLNGSGGRVLLGVTKSGTIAGQDIATVRFKRSRRRSADWCLLLALPTHAWLLTQRDQSWFCLQGGRTHGQGFHVLGLPMNAGRRTELTIAGGWLVFLLY
jgi:hypothetical protein